MTTQALTAAQSVVAQAQAGTLEAMVGVVRALELEVSTLRAEQNVLRLELHARYGPYKPTIVIPHTDAVPARRRLTREDMLGKGRVSYQDLADYYGKSLRWAKEKAERKVWIKRKIGGAVFFDFKEVEDAERARTVNARRAA